MRRIVCALAWVLIVCLAGVAGAASDKDRYGVMGKVLGYDPVKQTVEVKVVETTIPEWGNHVGKRPPRDIKAGKTYVFSVEPEGSVLRRTVIRTQGGSTLDRTASQEGFTQAIKALPDDRLLGLSLARSGAKDDAPAYKVMMIQIPRTLEEAMERLDEISVEE